MSVGRSDSRHKADSSFHAITEVPRILDALTVLMMGINRSVNDAHYRDAIVEASQEHPGDQVVEKMVSSRKHSSLSPEGCKIFVQTRALVVMRESVGFTRASNTARMIMLFIVKSLSRAKSIAEKA